MILKKIFPLFLLLISSIFSFAQDDNKVNNYIETFKELAITEQIRTGVPASIKLAQGIYETGAGISELATKAHNHFGIKCKTTWKGETFLHDDDLKQECFRKYSNDEASYKDHSDFLLGSNRYHFLFDLSITDYPGWASGLKRAGYATNPTYVTKLNAMVEKYNLQQYTYEAIARSSGTELKFVKGAEVVPNNDASYEHETSIYKGLKGFWAKKGDMLLGVASEKKIRYAKLLSMNDLEDAPLENDMFIFIERKNRLGTTPFHQVQKNETMLLISQLEAIELDNLYKFNLMQSGQEPAIGERLYLQTTAEQQPHLKTNFLAELGNRKSEPEVVVEQKVERKIEKRIEPKIEKQEDAIAEIEPVKSKVEEEFEPTLPVSRNEIRDAKKAKKEAEKMLDEQEEIKTEITKTEPNSEEPLNPKIKDAKKAKLMDELLNTELIDELPKKKNELKEVITTKIEPREEESKAPSRRERKIAEKERELAFEAEMQQQKLLEEKRLEEIAKKEDQDKIEFERQKDLARKSIEDKKYEQARQAEIERQKEIDAETAKIEKEQKEAQNVVSEIPTEVIHSESAAKTEPMVAEVIEAKIIEPIKEEPKLIMPISPTRFYNEQNVGDSVKELKKKFDKIIYAPKAPRKIDTVKSVQVQPATKVVTPTSKIILPKKDTLKKETTKKVIAPAKTISKKPDTSKVEIKKNVLPKAKVEKQKLTAKKIENKGNAANDVEKKKVDIKKKDIEKKPIAKKETPKKEIDKKVTTKKVTTKKKETPKKK